MGVEKSMFSKAHVSTPGKQRVARSPSAGAVIIHATAAETDGAFGMWETFTPPGRGPLPHMHTRETEVFRVIKGIFRFRCGDEEFEAGPGTVVALPPNVEHSWTNISDEPGQVLGMVTPGGFEQLFIDIEATGADTPEKIAVIEARLGLINAETQALAARATGSAPLPAP
jgi:mannose-6-phosphate isomerase-like protein (cupin superfamily)